MNLLSYKRYNELFSGKHVVFSKQAKNLNGTTVEENTKGVIIFKKEDLIEILLETGVYVLLDKNDSICLTIRNDLSLEDAGEYLINLCGHHCPDEKYVQLNIKYKKLPTAPKVVEEELSEGSILSHIDLLQEDTIKSFCNTAISTFRSVVGWSVQGQSGGYIVLELDRSFEDTLFDISVNIDNLERTIEFEPENISLIEDLEYDICHLSDTIINTAYDIGMIAKLITVYKQRLLDTISDVNTWSILLSEARNTTGFLLKILEEQQAQGKENFY